MQEKIILVAEDSIVSQRIAVSQLTKHGYRVEAVNDGKAAVAAATTKRYDLILMDCAMPEMDGYEATTEIRKQEAGKKHTLIVAMTANSEADDKAKCLAAGMDDFITKPVNAADLDAIIRRAVAENEKLHAETPASSPIDSERLREALGDDLPNLIQLYLSETSQILDKLAAAIETENAAEVELLAHNCAGTSANCGILALVGPSRTLEKAGREKNLEGCAATLAELKTQLSEVEKLLQNEIASEQNAIKETVPDGRRILLIDDQQVIANVYRSKLEGEGFAVDIASDGQQGLARILETKPDLVLLDWNLPKLSGLNVLKQVRAKREFSEMPIVVLSISSFAPMVEEAKREGANMVLSKTQHSPNMVVEVINAFVSTN
ncbi:MAG TPA: response regulator [Pyrinomonadaceae bacterium]